MEKFFKWLDSKNGERLQYGIIILSFSYFVIRFSVGIIWDI